jgi:hypothetical protein
MYDVEVQIMDEAYEDINFDTKAEKLSSVPGTPFRLI